MFTGRLACHALDQADTPAITSSSGLAQLG
jgi:hypothetical protein